MIPNTAPVGNVAQAGLLADAFQRFSDASAKLEEHHEELQDEIRVLKEQLREKEIEIERATRLSTLGEMAAAIAHEVRNPLGAIKLFLSLLRSDVKGNAGSLKIVDQMNTSITGIEHVVSNILHFAKDGAYALAPVNVPSIIREQIALVDPLHKGKAVITLTSEGSPFVAGDEHALRRAFHNLILNSLQAMKYAGTVKITISERPDRSMAVVIRDNGPGIPAEVLPKLFEPFVTSRTEGTGLGLAIVKRIVTQHKGVVGARNDNGAIFTIIIPR